MLDEGQAIVFVKEFTLETFIEPRCCSNSDFGLRYSNRPDKEEPGAFGGFDGEGASYFHCRKDLIHIQFQRFPPQNQTIL